jgi:hypothetical protein
VLSQYAEVGYGLAAGIALIGLGLGLSVRVASGAGGVFGYIASWLVNFGLVGGAVAAAPLVAQASYDTADQLVLMATGSGVAGLDVIKAGFDLMSRVWNHGVTGSAYNPLNWLQYIWVMALSAVLFVGHLWLSWLIGWTTILFWLSAAVMPILLPIMFIPPLAGIGAGGLSIVVSNMIRLLVLGLVIGVGRDLVEGIVIPPGTEEITMLDIGAAIVAVFTVSLLAWASSSIASSIARSAAPSTGLNSFVTAIAGGAMMRGSTSGGGMASGGARSSLSAGAMGGGGGGGHPPTPPPAGGAAARAAGGGGGGNISRQTRA